MRLYEFKTRRDINNPDDLESLEDIVSSIQDFTDKVFDWVAPLQKYEFLNELRALEDQATAALDRLRLIKKSNDHQEKLKMDEEDERWERENA